MMLSLTWLNNIIMPIVSGKVNVRSIRMRFMYVQQPISEHIRTYVCGRKS